MSQRKIGTLNTEAAIKLLEYCEDDLSKLAKMIALDVSRDSFLYRKTTRLISQVSDLLDFLEKPQEPR